MRPCHSLWLLSNVPFFVNPTANGRTWMRDSGLEGVGAA